MDDLDKRRRQNARIKNVREEHVKRFNALRHVSMRALGRSAGLPYLRVNRYLTGGYVRFSSKEQRQLADAITLHEMFQQLDRRRGAA